MEAKEEVKEVVRTKMVKRTITKEKVREVSVLKRETMFEVKMDPTAVAEWAASEKKYMEHDAAMRALADGKNELETYTYEMRDNLEFKYKQTATPAEAEPLMAALMAEEDWCYSEEADDADLTTLMTRLATLQAMGNPIEARYKAHEAFPEAVKTTLRAIEQMREFAKSTDEKYDHITDKDRAKCNKAIDKLAEWLEATKAKNDVPANQDLPVAVEELAKHATQASGIVTNVMSKAKPPVSK
ncbi:hypothetical protein KIPB_010232, partial [Kipferlia bialata]|eukprot:g10232.t1